VLLLSQGVMHQQGHFTLLGPFFKPGDQSRQGAFALKGIFNVLIVCK
jgi:hypothetical protein